MTHLELVRQRQDSPSLLVDAQKRVDAVSKRMASSKMNTIAHLLQEAEGFKAKTIWLKALTDELHKVVGDTAPCKAGCSHCCHMSTLITQAEAEALSKASGRVLATPPPEAWDQDADTANPRYEGAPCPFLADGLCSVYDARPFACRVHYSMDADSLLCQIVPGEKIRTPTLDTSRFTLMMMLCYGNPLDAHYADIRDFFPT